MFPIRTKAQVGDDGVLVLRLVAGPDAAGMDVRVTIEPAVASAENEAKDQAEWHRFVEETYGSCAGLGLERHEQGEFEERDLIE